MKVGTRDRFIGSLAFGAFLTLGALGCYEDIEPDVGLPLAGACDPDDTDPDRDVSYSAEIQPIFDRAADTAPPGCSCHQPSGPFPGGVTEPIGLIEAGLNLSSYDTLMQGGIISASRIVVPGDPCSSILFQKVTISPPYGSRMPLDGPPYLTPQDIALIHDWIAEGAANN